MARARIGVLASNLAGGVGRNVLNLANVWLARGVAVDVLLQDLSGPYMEQLSPEVGRIPLRTTHALSGVPRVAGYVRRHRPDILLTASPRMTVLALRARALAGRRTRIFANLHNTYSHALRELSPHKARKRLQLIRRHYPRCDGIVPVSQGVQADFQALTGIPDAAFRVIHNPVDRAGVRARAADPVALEQGFGDPGAPLLTAVGRVVAQKNLPLLLEAFERLRRERPARLAIIGEGKARPGLEEMARQSAHADDIRFLGLRANPFNLMAASQGVVLSSAYEGFGNVLAEAMALGVPVAATDCPHGPRELLESGRWGPLVPVDDAEALAGGMAEILDRPHPPEALQGAVAHLEADRVAREYLSAFELGEGGGGA